MHIFIFIYTYIYTDICIYLLRGNIAVKRRNASDTLDIALDAITQVAFKNFINVTMPMYNWIECSHNYSDTSGSLWEFKRDEIHNDPDVNNDDNASSFKYKASNIGNTENNGTRDGVKIVVPLKY